jgi:betaine-aldehyde dehydrogenase
MGEKIKKYKMWINGEWIDAESGKTSTIINPANGEAIAEVPKAGIEDVRKAIDAARDAYDNGPWGKTSPAHRASIVLKIADLVEQEIDKLAMLETLDQGKPIKSARYFDFPFGVDNMRYFAGAARELNGKPAMEFGAGTSILRREPVGVVGGIAPWNFPWMMMVWKVIGPLVTGNTVVFKPASITPVTSLEFARIIKAAGVPPGVVNVITGPGSSVGTEMSTNPKVNMITLTGDTVTGRTVMENCGSTVKKPHLELGGKAPLIVFDDANLNAAVQGAVAGAFINCGQICIQATRMIVQDTIYDKFVDKFVKVARKIVVGPGEKWETDMGPMVSAAQRETTERYIKIGKDEGAKLVLGGGRPKGAIYEKGFYVEPTVFTDVDQSMTIAREEIFGPAITIQKFSTMDEAIEMSNDVIYGLWSAVWTKDVYKAFKVANALDFGSVMVNEQIGMFSERPHGGFKESGWGKALSTETLESCTRTKHVYVDLTDEVERGWHPTVFGTALKPK